MIDLIRRLLGMNRWERIIPSELRDRSDALRSAKRADSLAETLRSARLREMEIRLDIRKARGHR